MITKVTERQGYSVAEFVGVNRFTLATVNEVKSELHPLFTQPGRHLAIDFQNIEFIDSSAIGCLISLVKAAKNNQGAIKLCNVNSDIMEVLELLHLPKVFDIAPTVEESF